MAIDYVQMLRGAVRLASWFILILVGAAASLLVCGCTERAIVIEKVVLYEHHSPVAPEPDTIIEVTREQDLESNRRMED